MAKVLELQLQHQSFQWIFRVDFLKNWLFWSPCCPRDSQESSPAPQFKNINSWHSTFFMVQLSHPYMTTGKTITLTIQWRRQWHPTLVLLPGKFHGRRSLVGYSPWGHEELDTTERLHFHFSLSCIGEGNGNPLQCSCLENPRDGGAWWAAVCVVAQSQTWLKQLSSSSIVRKFLNERS